MQGGVQVHWRYAPWYTRPHSRFLGAAFIMLIGLGLAAEG